MNIDFTKRLERVEHSITKRPRGPTSERAYWIEETAKMLGVPFKIVLYKTIQWKKEWIEDMYLHCSRAENPARLWWGLVKKNA